MLRLGGQRVPRGEARLLLRHVLAISAAELLARPERPLGDAEAARFESLLRRREAGEPVAYIVGEREFYGRLFRVTPAVLIPRPETELLVELALERIRALEATARVLDLGTGSGAIAITLALEAPAATVIATDASVAALAVARDNAARLGARADFREAEWFSGLGSERFGLIVANPPYVAEGDPHLEQGDLPFEPREALVSGADGLDAIRIIVADARAHLAPGGWLLLEHGYDQAQRCRALLEAAGFAGVASFRDLAGVERVSTGRSEAGAIRG